VLAFVLMVGVWRTFRGGASPQPAAVASAPAAVPAAGSNHGHGNGNGNGNGRGEVAMLATAYGLAGFGYIVTATFLPVIARTVLPGSPWLDMFWPIFGVGVITGALLATRLRITGDLRLLLAGSYLVQAAGIAVSVWLPSLAGYAVGSLMLGIPFTAITFFAMQEVRRLRPAQVASTMGLLTAVYGIGQIIGPPLVALLLRHSATAGEGFTRSLEAAMGALGVGALLYLWMVRAHPVQRAARSL
jgi:hypothetical protein